MVKQELIEIPVSEVVVKSAPRSQMGDIETLVRSIRRVGLLHPILVDANNVLIAGSRRLAACRAAGLQRVAARRFEIAYDSVEALGIRSDENLCRLALTGADLDAQIRAKREAAQAERPLARIFGGIRRIFATG